LSKEPSKGQASPHTYQEDTHRWALEQAFLGGGFVPSRHDEYTPAIVAMMAASAVELDGTYEISDWWVSSSNTGKCSSPFFVVKSYQQELEFLTRVDRRLSPCLGLFWPTHANRNPHLPTNDVAEWGGVMHRGDRGGGVISSFSSSSFEDSDSVGVSSPRSFTA
jgi:hypothetical protein